MFMNPDAIMPSCADCIMWNLGAGKQVAPFITRYEEAREPVSNRIRLHFVADVSCLAKPHPLEKNKQTPELVSKGVKRPCEMTSRWSRPRRPCWRTGDSLIDC